MAKLMQLLKNQSQVFNRFETKQDGAVEIDEGDIIRAKLQRE
jgi:hypothetical protein